MAYKRNIFGKAAPTLSVLFVILFAPCDFATAKNNDNLDTVVNVPVGNISPGIKVRVRPEKAVRRAGIAMQKYDYSCGSAALTTLIGITTGLKLDEEKVIEGLLIHGETEKIKEGRRFSLLDMKLYMETLGIEGSGYSASIEDLPDIRAPAIVSIVIKGFRHFVVYKGLVNGHVVLADPAYGNMTVSIDKFNKLWKQKIFFVVNSSAHLPIQQISLDKEALRFVNEDAFLSDVLNSKTGQTIQLNARRRTFTLRHSGIYPHSFK